MKILTSFVYKPDSRIFFISAKEALQTRLQEARGQKPNISTEDYFPRYLGRYPEKPFASMSYKNVFIQFDEL